MDQGLLTDCGGLIQAIAFVIPSAFFSETGAEVCSCKPLLPFENLISRLPPEIAVYAIIDHGHASRAKLWVQSSLAGRDVALVPLDEHSSPVPSPWAQDLFHVRLSYDNGCHVRQGIIADADCVVARALAHHLGYQFLPSGLVLPGGNQLVGPDFRLIGHSSLEDNPVGRDADVRSQEQRRKVIELDTRPASVFGYHHDQIRPEGSLMSDDDLRSMMRDPTGATGIHQCGFHVDQFVSVTGIRLCDRPLLLVAKPTWELGQRNVLAENLKQQLDACVRLLECQGFRVVRNPIPMEVTTDSGKRLPRLYNNVLLENAIRPGKSRPLVWVPQFGDVEPLEKYDRLNLDIWHQLGFEPVSVPGWSHFASRNGAVRCATKVLARNSFP
ncbi:MAG: hypothetical protein LCH47_09425 [Proteobacteria bacterium]|nr:hypothetical protein [Pseudomonadota bacterium]